MIHKAIHYTHKSNLLWYCAHNSKNAKQMISLRQFSQKFYQTNDRLINCHSSNNVTIHLRTIFNSTLRPRLKSSGNIVLRNCFCTKPTAQTASPVKDVGIKLSSVRKQHRETKRELKRLFLLAKDEKWSLLGAIGCLVISSSVAMGVPYAIGKILDMIVQDNFPKDKLHGFCLMLFFVFVAGSLANFGRIYLMNSASKCAKHAMTE